MRQLAIGTGLIELLQGDITAVEADAIVNAANEALAGGGGVDGAIHRVGGPSIMEETRRRYPQGCRTGDAVVTGAGELPAKWVIHAVAPVWRGGGQGEPELLRGAYRTALLRAADLGAKSVALPSLGTGVYGNPEEPSARLALEEAVRHLQTGNEPLQVIFVLYGLDTLAVFERELDALAERL